MSDYPISDVRREFPVLNQSVHGHPLTYLDSAATTLKPHAVIAATEAYNREYSANIHRGVHRLSERATAAYEGARETVRGFINAVAPSEVIFTAGTTASINTVANSLGRGLDAGDEIIISHMEHHSNLVPWQMLCEARGCVLKVIPISDAGELDVDAYRELLGPRTRLVSLVAVSNSLGTVNPVKPVVEAAHSVGARVLIDAAQAVACMPVDVQAWDCDFLAFSGHKLFGPTGIGVLYGRRELLDALPPFMGGGDMILSVTLEKTLYAKPPAKFEAGTPNISGAIGLGAAIAFVQAIGIPAIAAHEASVEHYARQQLAAVDGVRFIGEAAERTSIVSFLVGDIHPHDLGSLLDAKGVAIRAGHHCTQPVMQRFGIPATARASFSMYNTREDVDRLVQAVRDAKQVME